MSESVRRISPKRRKVFPGFDNVINGLRSPQAETSTMPCCATPYGLRLSRYLASFTCLEHRRLALLGVPLAIPNSLLRLLPGECGDGERLSCPLFPSDTDYLHEPSNGSCECRLSSLWKPLCIYLFCCCLLSGFLVAVFDTAGEHDEAMHGRKYGKSGSKVT